MSDDISPLEANLASAAENEQPVSPPVQDRSGEVPATQQDITRLRRLLWAFGALLALLVAPNLVSRIQYALVEAEERARFDVASKNLPKLNQLQVNSALRMLFSYVDSYVGPSVVHIRTHNGHEFGQGSGVIVDPAGYIVTNFHVVEGSPSVEVQLSDGRRGSASVVGSDSLVDLAVLKTELTDLHAAEWGDSNKLNVGEWVWALGSPFGFEKSVTFGILSAKDRRGIPTERSSVYQEYLQTDAAVNPGNSGGPLVNYEGKIVGINTAILGATYQGISFSIPSSIAQASYEQLRKQGHIVRGYLGVEPRPITDRVQEELGLDNKEGVLVWRLSPDTPASEAGIRPLDIILKWNGTEFTDPTLLSQAIAATPIGTEVPVELLRQRQGSLERKTLTVKVAARPINDSL